RVAAVIDVGLLRRTGAAAQPLFFLLDARREAVAQTLQLVVAVARDLALPFVLALVEQRVEMDARVRGPRFARLGGQRIGNLVEPFAHAHLAKLDLRSALDEGAILADQQGPRFL